MFMNYSTEKFDCDFCRQKRIVRICRGCNMTACRKCYTKHRKEVNDD